jgi:uncharacterized protein (TIGR00725 family)
MNRTLTVGIMGPGDKADATDLQNAWKLGALIAQNGWNTLTGARRAGIMEEALRGAKEHGGLTIGIIPGKNKDDATPYADIVIPTDMGNARNVINILASDVVVAIRGNSAGTLSEAFIAVKDRKPLILLGADTETTSFVNHISCAVVVAETPEEAIGFIKTYTP